MSLKHSSLPRLINPTCGNFELRKLLKIDLINLASLGDPVIQFFLQKTGLSNEA